MANVDQQNDTDAIWQLLAEIPDPEIPVINLTELGVIRSVRFEDDLLVVCISPTYSGCPATSVIKDDVEKRLAGAGLSPFRVEHQISPPWTSEWISDEGREKLKKYGIAPPNFADKSEKTGVPESCPLCGSAELEKINEFGSTPCKALWRCTNCLEPFDYFKCI